LEEHLRRQRMAQEDILTAGLIIEGERGLYDRFRSRVMFPIRDVRGHVIGFGGRVLDDGVPKYMNTPQTPLFDKSSVLYGIDLAREGIRASDEAVIVEGYMDVIVPYQAGVRNLVACMGTALTEQHIDILKRLTHRLILALDPDAAGMHAVERGVETAQQTLPRRVVPVPTAGGLIRYEAQLDAEIRVLMLPDGLDPDELILQDRARWDRLVAEALPVAEYFFRLAMAQIDASTARGKRDAMERIMPVLAAMDNLAERTHYVQRLAQWIRVDERELAAELDRRRSGAEPAMATRRAAARPQPEPETRRPLESEPPAGKGGPLGLEERCLALLLDNPPLLAAMHAEAGLSAEDFGGINRVLYEALSVFAAGGASEPEAFAGRLDMVLRERVESLRQQLRADPPLSPEMIREDLTKSAIRLRKQRISRLIQELRFALQDAQGPTTPSEDARQLNETIERLTRDYLQIDQSYYAATYVGRKNTRDKTLANHGL
jgi:DNA primase